MSKTLNNVVLKVHFTLAANHNTNIADNDDISTAFGKIGKYLADLKSGAFTTAYTHPSYSSASTSSHGLYNISVNSNGHVTQTTPFDTSELSYNHEIVSTQSGSLGITLHNNRGVSGDKTLKTFNGFGAAVFSSTAQLILGNSTPINSGGMAGSIYLWGDDNDGCSITADNEGPRGLAIGFDSNGSSTGAIGYSFYPQDDYDLGTSSYKWRNVYAKNIYGNLTGNINHVVKNPTADTWYGVTFHENAGIAGTKELGTNDSLMVRITDSSNGGQTTFSLGNQIDTTNGGKYGALRIYTKLTSHAYLSGGQRTNSMSFGTDTKTAGDAFIPQETDTYDFGGSSHKWRQIWATTVYSNLTGNVAGNINHTNTDPTTAAGYGLTFHPDAGTTGTKALRTNDSVRVMLYNNATTGGYTRLTLGNNTAATSGGKNGIIQLYGESANRYCTLTCTGTKNLILDNDSGTGGTNFSPAVTDTYDLGTTSLKWRNIYASDGYLTQLYLGGSTTDAITYDTTKHRIGLPVTIIDNTNLGNGPLAIFSAMPHPEEGETYRNQQLISSNAISFRYQKGTTSADGKAFLVTGNTLTTGQDWNATGGFICYNNKGYQTYIEPDDSVTSHIYITLPNADGTLLTDASSLNPAKLSSAVSVSKGGTGRTTLTSNAIIAGNGTSNVKMIATASGALYATAANGAAQFGTLPVAQGGTGATTFTSGQVLIGNGTGAVGTRAIATSVTSGSTSLITSGGVYSALGGPYVGFKVYKLYPKDYTWKAVGSSGSRIWYISSAINVSADFVKVFGACISNFGGCKTWICLPYSASATTFNANLIDMSGGTTNPGTYFESLTSAYFDIKVFGVTKTSLP